MTLSALRDDALITTDTGAAVRLSLPWIRSLPLTSLAEPTVEIDGVPAGVVAVQYGDYRFPVDQIGDAADIWWFQQDRVALELAAPVPSGWHEVRVRFGLRIPYLPSGPEGPLTLRFTDERRVELDGNISARRSTVLTENASVRERPEARTAQNQTDLPDGWVLSASSFNWTPDMIGTDDAAADLVVGIVSSGLAADVEAEPGQLWRTFPADTTAQSEDLRARLEAVGGSVSIMGASIDDWSARGTRCTAEERLAFLLPQVEAAHRLGARGLRVPIGAAEPELLERVLPLLQERNLNWYEEIQGPQTPGSAHAGAAIDRIVARDDPRVRLLVDISMFMPAVPESYLQQLEVGGVPTALIARLREAWGDPETADEVVAFLRGGAVPAAVHTLYMDMLIRFGRSDASVIAEVLPWVGAFHLKFWDLDDEDGRVSGPIAALGELLVNSDFRGTLCSEWGGQEWLDNDPTTMTRDHLALARTALSSGIRHSPLAAR
mgnify:FL=1